LSPPTPPAPSQHTTNPQINKQTFKPTPQTPKPLKNNNQPTKPTNQPTSYDLPEKIAIAQQYLIPKARAEAGIPVGGEHVPESLTITEGE
jgi:hypothetical protein